MGRLRVKRALSVAILTTLAMAGAYITPAVYADSSASAPIRPDAYDMVTPTIMIKGERYHMFKQFVDQDEALRAFAATHRDEINYVRIRYKVPQYLNKTNWREYRDIANAAGDDYDYLEPMGDFLTWLDNGPRNELIKYKVAHNDFERLEYLMPYFSRYVTDRLGKPVNLDQFDAATLDRMREQDKQNRATNLPNMAAAISYASDYATRNNFPKYGSFPDHDCTNFVSQILEAGGVRQEIYDEKTKGWWHKRKSRFLWFLADDHEYSDSWRLADVFVRYMGLSYWTRSNYDFSSRLNRGTIIAFDKHADGSWDHVAFVLDVKNHPGNYAGKVYYDYEVAQHTSDYVAWASEDANHWETLEDEGYKYGIVRQ